jgi:hypothetical protein
VEANIDIGDGENDEEGRCDETNAGDEQSGVTGANEAEVDRHFG